MLCPCYLLLRGAVRLTAGARRAQATGGGRRKPGREDAQGWPSTLGAWAREKCHTGEGGQVPFRWHRKGPGRVEQQQNRNREGEEGLQSDEENRSSGASSKPKRFPIRTWHRTGRELTEQPWAGEPVLHIHSTLHEAPGLTQHQDCSRGETHRPL